jgi:predicted alpha/beta-hydrolase family hydrolase
MSINDAGFLIDGAPDAEWTILLAHGAGAPMDSASMTSASAALAGAGFRVVRFEFAYMAARRTSGTNRPPPKAETLNPEYLAAIEALGGSNRLIIGGKSMGGRVASMVADELHAKGKIAGLLCLGYPFHPPGKLDKPRTAHLKDLKTPTLICQGTRDEFGAPEDVSAYMLSKQIEILWLEDGDHDLKPRKKISGFSAGDHLATMAAKVRLWADSLQ